MQRAANVSCTQFTCFTSTKVLILTPEELVGSGSCAEEHDIRWALRPRRYCRMRPYSCR
jgi:hypothetical protein